jgi:Kef-type K+ transport system membrane component KefB
MEQNVGGIDRTVRLVTGPLAIVVGVAILLNVLQVNPLIGAGLFVVGAILSVTGISQKCPMHRILGINTCTRTREA